MNSFSVGWMTVLCQPDQKIVLFIPGSNEEFTIELYKEELGKSYLKIDLLLCNVSNVDDAAISITPQSSDNIQGYFCQNSCYREGKVIFWSESGILHYFSKVPSLIYKKYCNLAQNNLIAVPQVELQYFNGNKVDMPKPKCGTVNMADGTANGFGYLFAATFCHEGLCYCQYTKRVQITMYTRQIVCC